MNQQELYCLFEDQDISETETFNIFDIKPPSSFFQNKIGLFFSSSNNIEEYQIIEELKKAMEESESEKGKSEINEESSFKQKKKIQGKKINKKKFYNQVLIRQKIYQLMKKRILLQIVNKAV